MRFTWDETKRRANKKKHRLDYGEQRWITIGLLHLVAVVIAHTETEEEIHVISMRKAEKAEQEIYFANI
jgi:uncharacterized DUF497 family protein